MSGANGTCYRNNNNQLNHKSTSRPNPRLTFFKDVPKLFYDLQCYLNSSRIMDGDLEHYFESLENGFNQILELSINYEYKNLPANGFVTYCVMIRSFLQYILDKPCKLEKPKVLSDLKSVLKGFLLVKTLLQHFHQNQLNHVSAQNLANLDLSVPLDEDSDVNRNDVDKSLAISDKQKSSQTINLPLFSHDIEETIFQMDNFARTTEFQEALARSFPLFWLSPKTRTFIKFYATGISWGSVNFFKSFRVLANKRYRCKHFVKAACRANIGFPFDMAAFLDSHSTRKLFRNVLSHNKLAVGRNFWIPAQGKWFIPNSGPGIIEANTEVTNRPPVHVRLIRHRNKPVRKDVLIFHVHGSGFVISRPEIHDIYLKPWVSKLDGVSVLSVDYTLKAQFPLAFQDVLDAYLWLTSGDPLVERKIGFHPKKIVVIGDSAGSMLGLTISFMLSEIERKCKNIEIIFPSAFVSFYGTFHLTGAWATARFMTAFDPILHYGNILAIAGCLSGLQGQSRPVKKPPKNRLAKVSSYIAEDFKSIKQGLFPRDIEPWYLENGLIAPQQFRRINSMLQSPYLDCPTFTLFDRLKDIPIYLISSFGCIFLDDNIEIAKCWKGPVEIHVLEGQIHGFLFMRHEKAAIKFADNKIIEIVNKVADTKD